MLCSVFTKKSGTEDQIMSQESNISMSICICRLLGYCSVSSIGAVGSELRVGADAGAASRVLFGGRARSYPSR